LGGGELSEVYCVYSGDATRWCENCEPEGLVNCNEDDCDIFVCSTCLDNGPGISRCTKCDIFVCESCC